MTKPFTKDSFDLKYTTEPTGCWEWKRVKNQDGYGRVRVNGHLCSAHRVAYHLYKGEIGDKHVCHTCDNPGCVNPEHLFLGTHLENQQDKKQKGRGRGLGKKGESHKLHKLTEESVISIRSSSMSGKDLGILFGVSPSLVNNVKARKCWKHIL
jgi:hypothetical protein